MPTIHLVRGSRTETFESPYDNEQALRRLQAMLRDRTVNSSFAAEKVRACEKRTDDANAWAWLHRIVVDHEKNKHPGTVAPAKRQAAGGTTAQAIRREALLNDEQVREFVKGLLRAMTVAEVRRHIDDSFFRDASNPTQAANWQACGREIERLYPTTLHRKYITGPEDEAWAVALIAAFGAEGALAAVLDVQREVVADALPKWGKVETEIRRRNALNAATPKHKFKFSESDEKPTGDPVKANNKKGHTKKRRVRLKED